MTKNPYDVLGVPQSATDDEVKKAYRDLSRKYGRKIAAWSALDDGFS